ncbi:MAG: alpha-L-fucosidase [Arachidicoccus sp.]|nr:alpha-L-fucosidase [Arachidicoccus sp.]
MFSLKKCISLLSVLIFLQKPNAQKVAPPKPYGVLPNQNQLSWQENNLYAFIHIGLNTFTNKEWGYGDEDPKLFDPQKFDADKIVRTIKQGGFTGIILTCKHHDGFCLWPTKTTEHNITKSPFRNGKGDLVKEVEQACKKYGMRFGVYLSPWDRNAASYGTQDYINNIYRKQLTELLTRYGPIFEIWHDGANGGDGFYGGAREQRKIDRATYYGWDSVWKMEARLQPSALRFGDIGPDLRWVGNEKGYAGNPCWQTFTPISDVPGKDPAYGQVISDSSITGTRNGKYWMPAEVDFSIRPGWFWHASENDKVRTAEDLLKHYFLSVGRGAAMILNVPPDKDGLIYPTDSINLKKFGELIKATFGKNLAKGAVIKASNVRGNDDKDYGTKHLLDDDQFSYWSTDDNIHTPQLIITLPEERSFDIIRLKENTKLGQRIDSLTIEAWLNNGWQYICGASSIGSNRLIKLDNIITARRLRINIIQSPVCVALSDFGLFKLPKSFSAVSDDVSKTKRLSIHSSVINIKNADKAIDNNSSSFWKSPDNNFPQSLVLDVKKIREINSISYLPEQDGKTSGMIDKYAVYTSNDNKSWKKIIEGEFANIQANPILQQIALPAQTYARYIKFEMLHTIDGKNPVIAEIALE